VQQKVQNKDGSVTIINVVDVMTIDQMREAGASKMADPAFITSNVEAAMKREKS